MLPDSIIGTRAWRQRRLVVLDRDGYRCQVPDRAGLPCGRPATHCDHKVPRSAWPPGVPGVDELPNLQAACAACNLRKGATGSLRRWAW